MYYPDPEYGDEGEVIIDDINGDIESIKNTPILSAYKATKDTIEIIDKFSGDTLKWTFYHISTIRGSVTIRWHSISDMYSISFEKIEPE